MLLQCLENLPEPPITTGITGKLRDFQKYSEIYPGQLFASNAK